jgi:hypothetical protein
VAETTGPIRSTRSDRTDTTREKRVTDERPKPRFGELAPEGWKWEPPADATPEEPTGAEARTPAPVVSPWPVRPAARDSAPVPAPAPAPAAATFGPDGRPVNRADRIATIALLAIGLIWTANTISSLVSLPDVMNQVMEIWGIDSAYTGTATANTAGVAGAALTFLVFALTAVYSIRRVRQNKLAFFIPIIGAVVAGLISFTVVTIAIMADPVILDTLTRVSP